MRGRRSERAAEQIRAELAELVENEVADPRVGSVVVTGVRLSADGKQAEVLVSRPDRGEGERECLRGLESARGFLRHELATRLQLRHTPELRFTIDHGPEHARRVEVLLERIKKRAPLLVLLLAATSPGAEMLRYEASAPAMGSVYTVAAYHPDRANVSAAVEAAFREARRIDELLSNYRPDSELSEVNRRAAERPVKVSPELFDLLERCQQYSRLSEGAFDWTVGSLMRVWGFYKGSGRLPQRAAVEQALGSAGYQRLELDGERRTVRFQVAGMELDPGGIGKGYAVDRMLDVLREAGIEVALISASGSSIYALGSPPGEKGWHVRVRDPKSESLTVAELYLKDQSFSTSGAYEKFFEAEGKTYSHIMDPRTGYPARGMASVSVLAPRTLDSEAWTKPLFVNGGQWARRRLPSGMRALLCEENKPCYWLPAEAGE